MTRPFVSYGFQMAELRLDSFENIQFFDVCVFSQIDHLNPAHFFRKVRRPDMP